MIIEGVIIVCLVFGGALGYGVSKSTEKKQEIVTEPELWKPKQHIKMLKYCSVFCKKSGSKFKSYESMTGDCNCE